MNYSGLWSVLELNFNSNLVFWWPSNFKQVNLVDFYLYLMLLHQLAVRKKYSIVNGDLKFWI